MTDGRNVIPNGTIFRSIPEQIVTQLRLDILSGVLAAGQPLREADLAESFNVSRGPVREVLRMLTQEGLLVATPNKGVTVANRPSSEARSLIVNLRTTIETYSLAQLFDHITDKDIAEWEGNLEALRRACIHGDTAQLVEQDLQFHGSILRSHDDHEIYSLWLPIAHRMLIHYDRHGDLMESYSEHKRILDAIKDGNCEGALKALDDNIQ